MVREIEYHDRLYSGFAQSHFAKPAVRALRNHLVSNILRLTAPGDSARVLSLGCGIGDTELIMADRVGEIVGLDLSPAAFHQAQKDAQQAHVQNATFIQGTLESAQFEPGSFDLIIAIFFLHHLTETDLPALANQIRHLLRPGGRFYSLDPSRYRLSGAIGSLLVPKLMARYQSPNERPLVPAKTAAVFSEAGLETHYSYYDFISTPLAGLFPGWSGGYRAARLIDEPLVRIPGLRQVASNFQVISRRVLS
jgi:ubiquinone/menaquinone biosynthesis C-methylase UbiE